MSVATNDFGFSMRTSTSSVNQIIRAKKEGGVETVETQNKDYPLINPGEKLVWVGGMTKPYTLEVENKDRETGELRKEKMQFLKLEIQVLSGPQRGARFLINVTTGYVRENGDIKWHITKKTNFGKILGAILKIDLPEDYEFDPTEIVRKPFFMQTDNEQAQNYVKTKFISARLHDEAMDGPIPGATVTAVPAPPPPPPPPATPARPSAEELFNEDL